MVTVNQTRSIALPVALGALALLVVVSVGAPLLAPHDPRLVAMELRLAPPTAAHPLGNDGVGRDLLSRVLHGGRMSLLLTVGSTALTVGIAVGFGVAAGYFGGLLDDVLMVVTGLFHGIPAIAVLIAIAAVMDPGAPALLVGLVIVSWPSFSRVVRTEVTRIAALPFVEALRAAGASHARIIVFHLLPNVAAPILVLAAARMSTVIVSVASLSFLGLGIQPPTPDWGAMIRDAIPHVHTNPNLLIAPVLCVLISTYGFSALAEQLRIRLDVHRRGEAIAV
ncbi:MAG: ABC transporter permease [Spirochaetaceae bacterium]|nr:MAG: ABC transporter permease [Spirochaetaceae bacterium]